MGASTKQITSVKSANAIAGKGLENDRFFKNNNNTTSQLTLIESENIDNFNKSSGTNISYENFRRNIVTKNIRLNNLVNKEFFNSRSSIFFSNSIFLTFKSLSNFFLLKYEIKPLSPSNKLKKK